MTQTAQHFKELLEGNNNLLANRKYKDPLPIQKTPTIISMNGNRPEDLTEFCSEE